MTYNTSFSSSMFDTDSFDHVLELLNKVTKYNEELVNRSTSQQVLSLASAAVEETHKLQKLIDCQYDIDIKVEIPLLKLDKEVTDPINVIRVPTYQVNISALNDFITNNKIDIENINKIELCIFNKDHHKCSSFVLQGADMFKLHYASVSIHATSNKYKAIAYLQDINNLYLAMIQNVTGETAKKESKSKIDQSYLNTMELTYIKLTYRI